jgi:GT2 family glycosyltransferase
VIPTLAADSALLDCLRSLEEQTYRDFEVIVVDNSEKQLVEALGVPGQNIRVIANQQNAGFGGAINQGWSASASTFISTINDDATAERDWLSVMMMAAAKDPEIGMVAAQVRLTVNELDSAGMLISGDGSSKQRGHGRPPSEFAREEDVLMPSGSAALYRREMLEDTGAFAEEFFLYCEDTDLGLRARRRGWRCVYTPAAVVYLGYSRSAGRASALKAFLVERNRLWLVLRNFPARMLWRVPFIALARYFWHVVCLLRGQGKTAEFAADGNGAGLPVLVLKAHLATLSHIPRLLAQRRAIEKKAYMTPRQFERLLARHSISPKQVAAL